MQNTPQNQPQLQNYNCTPEEHQQSAAHDANRIIATNVRTWQIAHERARIAKSFYKLGERAKVIRSGTNGHF